MIRRYSEPKATYWSVFDSRGRTAFYISGSGWDNTNNVQREIFANTSLMIGYAGSRGEHLLRSNDVNTAMPISGPHFCRCFMRAPWCAR